MRVLFLIIFLKVLCSECRLFFPPNSDLGYIVSDDNDNIVNDQLDRRSINLLDENMVDFVVPEGEKDDNNDIQTGLKKRDTIEFDIPEELKDDKHGVLMGTKDPRCDDGELRLSIDWDGSEENYTCPLHGRSLPVDESLKHYKHCENCTIMPIHHCMHKKITYSEDIPTCGHHRPNWAAYGEYKYIPTQRWLHNLEHGAVVMLYHPCTKKSLVDELRSAVKRCLRRYIISPNNLVPQERPLVLLTWGCKFEMANVNVYNVRYFIRRHALQGRERIYSDGIYKEHIISHAEIPEGSNIKDKHLCHRFE